MGLRMTGIDMDLVEYLAGIDIHLGYGTVELEYHPDRIVFGSYDTVARDVRQRNDPLNRPVRDQDLGKVFFLERAQPDRTRFHEIVVQAMRPAGRG